ncbi:hypothetical protein CRENBAI_024678 [Crenichthys baileyi]|uniref:Uncharacterized protein n=1 Tax=Crenichthys baileyi TaxID=28760 RepID=A0AAV9RPL4_9TELE
MSGKREKKTEKFDKDDVLLALRGAANAEQTGRALCESSYSSDEEHLAHCQPFIVCHQYHLDNDLFWQVAMVMVICMEIMLVLVNDEGAADVMGNKAWVRAGQK